MSRKKECRTCEKMVFMKDVGETRNVYPGPRLEYLCKTCQREQLDAAIDIERARLGLPPLERP